MSCRTTIPIKSGPSDPMNEIHLGRGIYAIQGVSRNEGQSHGLMFTDTKIEHVINSLVHEANQKGKYTPTMEDFIIMCDNIESARVLQQQVNMMVLRFEGFSVEDDRDKEIDMEDR